MILIVLIDLFPNNFYQLFEKHGKFLKIEKGDHIFREGEAATDLYYVKNGSVQILRETELGKELALRLCGNKSIIGETDLFIPEGYHSTNAKAVTKAELYSLNKKTLELLLTEQPSLMIEYLKWVQSENLRNQSLLRDLILNGKKGALFSTLIRLANSHGEKKENGRIFINFYVTNTDLANLCATSREMINRMLNDLKKQGIITFDKGYITIIDFNYLRNAIGCNNCQLDFVCKID